MTVIEDMAMAIEVNVDTLPSAHLLTWDDWLAFEAGVWSGKRTACRYEILAGELYMSPGPKVRHQRVVRNLAFLLDPRLRGTGRGELFPDGTGVRLSMHDVVIPDLLVVLAGREGIVEEDCIGGAPDLVVEVLSPGTARRDLGVKRALYAHSGVAELWVVDPAGEQAIVYELVGGRYRCFGSWGRDERLRSAVLVGLELPLAEVFPPR